MTDEEIQREREEAERLIREINATIDRINRVNQENAELEYELEVSIQNVKTLIGNCGEMDRAVYEDMGFLSGRVGEADISTKHTVDAVLAGFYLEREYSHRGFLIREGTRNLQIF